MIDVNDTCVQEQLAQFKRINADTAKFIAEHDSAAAEAKKLDRYIQIAPWQLVVLMLATSALTLAGALLGASAARFLWP